VERALNFQVNGIFQAHAGATKKKDETDKKAETHINQQKNPRRSNRWKEKVLQTCVPSAPKKRINKTTRKKKRRRKARAFPSQRPASHRLSTETREILDKKRNKCSVPASWQNGIKKKVPMPGTGNAVRLQRPATAERSEKPSFGCFGNSWLEKKQPHTIERETQNKTKREKERGFEFAKERPEPLEWMFGGNKHSGVKGFGGGEAKKNPRRTERGWKKGTKRTLARSRKGDTPSETGNKKVKSPRFVGVPPPSKLRKGKSNNQRQKEDFLKKAAAPSIPKEQPTSSIEGELLRREAGGKDERWRQLKRREFQTTRRKRF